MNIIAFSSLFYNLFKKYNLVMPYPCSHLAPYEIGHTKEFFAVRERISPQSRLHNRNIFYLLA